jgi:hypothetical protein
MESGTQKKMESGELMRATTSTPCGVGAQPGVCEQCADGMLEPSLPVMGGHDFLRCKERGRTSTRPRIITAARDVLSTV